MLHRSIPPAKPPITPIPIPSLSIRTSSGAFKVHSLPSGRLPSSRCIRSALLQNMQLRTNALRGAPDTALRLIVIDLQAEARVTSVAISLTFDPGLAQDVF